MMWKEEIMASIETPFKNMPLGTEEYQKKSHSGYSALPPRVEMDVTRIHVTGGTD
jgi:hypothetical protein